MHQCINGMAEEHAGTGKAHNFADLFLIGGFIAVDEAFPASGFSIAKGTAFEALMCISFQSLAIITKHLLGPMFGTAVDADHS